MDKVGILPNTMRESQNNSVAKRALYTAAIQKPQICKQTVHNQMPRLNPHLLISLLINTITCGVYYRLDILASFSAARLGLKTGTCTATPLPLCVNSQSNHV